MDPTRLGAMEAAEAIRAGTFTSEALVAACLDRIAALETAVQAWAFLDPAYALEQARAADRAVRDGCDLGPLQGIPVGVKDVFDTADMPTENGTLLHAGRRPSEDAAAVALLRQAGAVILGKTVPTELGLVAPGKTRNPHDPNRTPGGSSSGSAAAVAAHMVPLAIGSQNNGSVIRPASYCGVVGFKPTFGRISRYGALRQSPSLDQVGVFARSVEDAALLGQALMGFDPRDPATGRCTRPDLVGGLAEALPMEVRLALVRSPVWDQAGEDTRQAFADLVRSLGDRIVEVELPPVFEEVVAIHRSILEPELAVSYAAEYDRGRTRLSSTLCQIIERAKRQPAVEYLCAKQRVPALQGVLADLFKVYDAILTPATTGVAPLGLESTGSPIFCTIWTLCGLPALSLPILRGSDSMPLGAQLVGAWGHDRRLLQMARWLLGRIPNPPNDPNAWALELTGGVTPADPRCVVPSGCTTSPSLARHPSP